MTYTHDELTNRLKEKITHTTKGELNILYKGIPFEEERRGLDPRVKRFLMEHVHPGARRPLEIDDLEVTRSKVEVNNRDLSSGIRATKTSVHADRREINVTIYNQQKKPQPVLIYLHGGGFFERDVDVMENVCRLLAQKAEALVVGVEYRLAPEHPYQDGLEDCLEAVKFIYEHADEYGVRTNQIGIVGDSVGANLALAVQHLSTDEPWQICYIGMLCPLVDFSDVSRESWNITHYDLDTDYELIYEELVTLKESLIFIQTLYLTNLEDVHLPLVSPLLRKDKSSLPPITLITAEFDYLRIQGEAFSRQLQKAGVPFRHFEYKGMDHAFVRKLGYYPQAADAISEIAAHFKQVLKKANNDL
ncbi:alpha/beta hydrolase [Bacillus daqingensis]|uniref:Alpha/beta hydrolase n=1 Tax=Bacillus daqingensis TaxID=872396 RepID=A0ABV9NV19_9BACI